MVHHSCYYKISFEADRLHFFLGPGPSAVPAARGFSEGIACSRSAAARFAQR